MPSPLTGQLLVRVSGDRILVSVEVKPDLAYQQICWTNSPHHVPKVVVPFLIDTGAPYCVIEEHLVDHWGMYRKPVRTMRMGRVTVSGHSYPLSLRLHTDAGSEWLHETVEVKCMPKDHFAGDLHTGIIGMDILAQGNFKYARQPPTFEIWW